MELKICGQWHCKENGEMSGQTAAVGQGALAALPLSSDNWRHGGLSIGALRDRGEGY